MQDVSLRCLIRTNGAYLHTELGVGVTTLHERSTDDGHGEVSLADNQHTNELLVTVDNVETAQLLGFLVVSHELVGSRLLEVAPVGAHHDGHITQLADRLHPVSVVDLPLETSLELSTVCRMALSAF